MARWATGDLRPHLTVLLDLPPQQGLARFEERDRIEAESVEFHERVREMFLQLAGAAPEHYLVVDARRPVRGDRRRDPGAAASRCSTRPPAGRPPRGRRRTSRRGS